MQEVNDALAGREPSFSDLEKLTYLNQVLKVYSTVVRADSASLLKRSFFCLLLVSQESMRVQTPAPFGARLVEQDFVLDKYHLPAGVC